MAEANPRRFRRSMSVLNGFVLRAALLSLLVLAASACSGPGYYVQAASGHWKLMRARQDISAILEDPASDPELVGQLREAGEVLQFAEAQLGLPAGDSYTEFVATGREAVTWTLVAAPEFSLTPKKWCFAVAGCVPYRGYFERQRARDAADRLARKGMDVAVTPATAYSTLGWFRDPVLDTMLSRTDMQLAATLIHELAHRRLYLKGNTRFNEAYARFVERVGVEEWLMHSGRETDTAAWRDYGRAADDFNRLLQETRELLAALYAAESPEAQQRSRKWQILEDMQSAYARMRDRQWAGRDYFAGLLSRGINNAHLALIDSYEGGHCAFAGLFATAGGDFNEFHRLAGERAKLDSGRLDTWLTASCTAVAPDNDL